jgi:hypothetical protein
VDTVVVVPPRPPVVPPFWEAKPVAAWSGLLDDMYEVWKGRWKEEREHTSEMEARLTISAASATSSDVGVGAARIELARRPRERRENFMMEYLREKCSRILQEI